MAHVRWNPWLSGFPGTLKSYCCQDGGYFIHTPQIRFSFSPARPEELCNTDILTTERKAGLCFHCRMWCTGQERQMEVTAALDHWCTQRHPDVSWHTPGPLPRQTQSDGNDLAGSAGVSVHYTYHQSDACNSSGCSLHTTIKVTVSSSSCKIGISL